MSRTHKDKKKARMEHVLNNNGPSSFKIEERSKRRAQSNQAVRENKEQDKTYIYSDWYW